jgi:peptidoglycan/xylan/chitin deacetylase (PgdA/CDA1 family)
MRRALFIKLATLLVMAACLGLLPSPWSWAGAGAALALALGVIAWGVFNVNSSLWAPTLWGGAEGSKSVALTFDDGPDEDFTPQVLAVLHEKNVKAAFFCVGTRARLSPDLVKQIVREGHLLGNHSFTHAMWINFGRHNRLRDEIQQCGAAIQDAAGVTPTLYRAPHGFKNPALGDVLRELGMTAVGWQIRGFDAVDGDAARIARRIVDGARPGGVIAMHDGSGLQGTPDRSATLEALPVIIDGLRARGLKLVRLDELLANGSQASP